MADNVAVTPGVGADIAADDVSGVYYQRVKLDIGGDGVSSPVVAGNGLPVTGPLTDTELRATPVPVSGTVTITDGSGPVSVDGTVAATQSGTWNVTNISGTVSLPTGAATEATLLLVESAVDGIEALLAGTLTVSGTVAISGGVTVSATNLDIRDLTSASDSVSAVPAANTSTTAATFAQAVNTIAAAATPEALVGTTTLVETVTIQAKKGFNSANTSAVFVGFSASNDSNYLELLPGDSVTLSAPRGKKLDLNLIYIEVVTNGDGVTYTSVN